MPIGRISTSWWSKMIEPHSLRQLLRYDRETGRLFWLPRPVELFKDGFRSAEHDCRLWNSRCAGKEAFTALNASGYRHGKVHGKGYLAHRIIWAMLHGAWPLEEVDHVNGVRSGNRPSNLRQASRVQNCRNRRASSRNTSGFKGVTWDKKAGKWQAQIGSQNSKVKLGYFEDPTMAHAAYCAAAKKLHGEFARLE